MQKLATAKADRANYCAKRNDISLSGTSYLNSGSNYILPIGEDGLLIRLFMLIVQWRILETHLDMAVEMVLNKLLSLSQIHGHETSLIRFFFILRFKIAISATSFIHIRLIYNKL